MIGHTPSVETIEAAGLNKNDLCAAESVLQVVSDLLARHYQAVGAHDYPREWVDDHRQRRCACVLTRAVLIGMIEQMERCSE